MRTDAYADADTVPAEHVELTNLNEHQHDAHEVKRSRPTMLACGPAHKYPHMVMHSTGSGLYHYLTESIHQCFKMRLESSSAIRFDSIRLELGISSSINIQRTCKGICSV